MSLSSKFPKVNFTFLTFVFYPLYIFRLACMNPNTLLCYPRTNSSRPNSRTSVSGTPGLLKARQPSSSNIPVPTNNRTRTPSGSGPRGSLQRAGSNLGQRSTAYSADSSKFSSSSALRNAVNQQRDWQWAKPNQFQSLNEAVILLLYLRVFTFSPAYARTTVGQSFEKILQSSNFCRFKMWQNCPAGLLQNSHLYVAKKIFCPYSELPSSLI